MSKMPPVIIANHYQSTALGIETFLKAEEVPLLYPPATLEEAPASLDNDGPVIMIAGIKNAAAKDIDTITHIMKRYPHCSIIAYTARQEICIARQLQAAGVQAQVSQQSPMEELLYAIEIVASGDTYHCPKTEALLGSGLIVLSEAQQHLVQLMYEGKTDKQISEALNQSPRTIESSKASIREKLQVKNNNAMVYQLVAKGILL